MKLHARFSVLAALALGLTLHAPLSWGADVFDWNNITYAPTPAVAVTKTSLGSSTGGTNTLSVQFGLSTGAAFSTAATSPISASNSTNTTYYTSGGGSTTQKSLQIVMNYASGSAFTTVTIFFAQPVVSVGFNFFDVDSGSVGSGTYNDQLRSIMGLSTTGGAVAPQSLTSITGGTSTVNDVNTVTANASSSAASTSNLGNVAVAFPAATAITQLSFIYGDTLTTTPHSTVQLIALSNITFTNVPEPGTMVLVGMCAAGAGVVALHRRGK